MDIARAPSPSWKTDIGFRMRHLFPLKLVGTTAFTCLFFVAYFHLLRNPAFPVTVMPLTLLDAWVPFEPLALIPYLSLWLYIGFAPGLQRSFVELAVYGLWMSAMCFTGLVIFYFWPTQIPPLTIAVSHYAGFAMLQGVDAPGNACPSMHVATAIFTAIRIDHVLRHAGTPVAFRLGNGVWFLAIAWSTVAVRQHVVLDVVAGALLGAAFALPALRWRGAPKGQ